VESRQGLFIVLDGPDGAGKTTQARRLEEGIPARLSRPALYVREPGGTALGEAVRSILLDPIHTDMTAEAELLLYMASRSQLCRTVIEPALREGKIVVADRFLSASVAYQGVGGGLGVEPVLSIGRFATGGVLPDLILILDLPPEDGFARGSGASDRIEQRDLEYHRRVRKGFLDLPAAFPGRVEILDARLPVDELAVKVLDRVEARYRGAEGGGA
jgi:dTMP kinase